MYTTIIEVYYLSIAMFIFIGGIGYQWHSASLSATRHTGKALKYIMHVLRGIWQAQHRTRTQASIFPCYNNL